MKHRFLAEAFPRSAASVVIPPRRTGLSALLFGELDAALRFALGLASVLVLTLCLSVQAVDEQKPLPANTGLQFLLIRANAEGFTLLKSEVRPGRFKQPRDGLLFGEVLCELTDAEGKVLWRGRLADPLRRRVEVADPANPGKFEVREVLSAETEFMLRVPHLPGATAARLHRIPPLEAQAAVASAPPSVLALPPLPREESR